MGQFLADVEVTQQQLTKAFLSSRQFEDESLGARWTEAQHTGVWRKTCREIVRFLNDDQYASAGSAGPTPAHGSAQDYAGAHDRNLFLCAPSPPRCPSPLPAC